MIMGICKTDDHAQHIAETITANSTLVGSRVAQAAAQAGSGDATLDRLRVMAIFSREVNRPGNPAD